MNINELMIALHKETLFFFENINTSEELQLKYDLYNYTNKDAVLNIINSFKNSNQPLLTKPLYELDYKNESAPRCLYIQRDQHGFITLQISGYEDSQPSIIEPLRFVSIIKEFIEDESIKKEMYVENNKEQEYDLER